jgi:hypothetical protein
MTDKEFILLPNKWPKWPFLPMKTVGPDPKCGLIVGDPNFATNMVVFLEGANVWHYAEDDRTKASTRDIDELLAEGWVID